MRSSVLELCNREKLFPPGCRVVCAVSGGADSVALLLFLRENRKLLGVGELACAHFDHGLRGEESREDAAFVRALAERLEIPFFLGSGDVAAAAAQRGKGLEEAGRALRYEFLEGLPGFDRIATAHTGDDNLETVLHHLIRGAGLRGLCGIPARRGRIVRPLLGVSREQVLEYLARRGEPYRTDSSNQSDAFTRNRLRKQVVPLLKAEDPSLTGRLAWELSLLRDDADWLARQARHLTGELTHREGETVWANCRDLLALPRALRTRLLGEMVGEITEIVPSARQIQAVERLLESTDPSAQVSLSGARAERRYEKLLLRPPRELSPFPELTLRPGDTVEAGEYLISCELLEKDGETLHSVHTFRLNYDIIKGDLILRGRRPGDRIRLRGRPGSRLLSDLMIDKKIPRQERDRIPVLADASGVLAVDGFGTRDDAEAETGHPVLCVRIKKHQGGIPHE